MGFFEFLKKKNSDQTPEPAAPDKPEERKSVFKGDLAFIQDTNETVEEKQSQPKEEPEKYEDWGEDSADSTVYLTFIPAMRNVWICSECGTRNDNGLNGCMVCGLKK